MHTLTTLCSTLLARRLSVVFPVLCMAVLLLLSSIPGTLAPDDPLSFRLFAWIPAMVQNFLHIPAYALLGFAWRWYLKAWMKPARAGMLAFAAAVGFGVLEESYQSIIPGRIASLTDILFNAIGAVLGIWLFNKLHRKYCEVETCVSSAGKPT
jgi:VanZ family protein